MAKGSLPCTTSHVTSNILPIQDGVSRDVLFSPLLTTTASHGSTEEGVGPYGNGSQAQYGGKENHAK